MHDKSINTKMEYQYDYPNVSKLLEWAKDRLQTGNYPKEPFQLNRCVKVNDCKMGLECYISTITDHWDNPTFHPVIKQLYELKEKIEEIEQEN